MMQTLISIELREREKKERLNEAIFNSTCPTILSFFPSVYHLTAMMDDAQRHNIDHNAKNGCREYPLIFYT